ncbi:16S rRNA (guanine(966)-N(2))-methyltransferase RsmD [Bacillus seohaeanensis]|jgi:16S rRNA (guanine966-N2)-methyltransferase|uniref:16S rRNA (Guanine(966)-N(2))-methyltransferase RsmD n=1 Tax=Bacillus seohaeanensis TaxID=284580 RepID=A0ABW5RX93_9BACI
MRVISGNLKGHPLKAVPGSGTRPTTDKVKESIFNIIGPYFDGGRGLDLFAGSGGLGIEAISRGLDSVVFVDRDGKAIHTIKMNLKACRLEKQSEVYRNDANRALKALAKRELRFDYIFLDPPYKQQQLEKILEFIDAHNLLNESGSVMCEHGSEVVLPASVGRFVKKREENYGIIGITIFQVVDEK